MSETATQPTADAVWEEASALFSNARGMRPRTSWLTGLSVAAGRRRLARLTRMKAGAKLTSKLLALSDVEFAVFQTYAQVNLEQAQAALRLSLIVNVTIPVGLLVISNQFFPRLMQRVIDFISVDATLLVLAATGAALGFAIWYCYAGVFQARDLAHLTAIAGAKRSVRPAAAASADDASANGNPIEPVEQIL